MSNATVQEIEEVISSTDSSKELKPEILDPKDWIVNGGKLLPTDDISVFNDQQASYQLNECVDKLKRLREELDEEEQKQNIASNNNYAPRDITYVDPYAEKIEQLKSEIERWELAQAQAVATLREHRMVFTLKGMGSKWVKTMGKINDKRTAANLKKLVREHRAALAADPEMSKEDEAMLIVDQKDEIEECKFEGQMYWYYTLLAKAIVKIEVPYANRVLNEVDYSPEQVRELCDELPDSQEVRLINAVNRIMDTSQMVDPLVDAGFPS